MILIGRFAARLDSWAKHLALELKLRFWFDVVLRNASALAWTTLWGAVDTDDVSILRKASLGQVNTRRSLWLGR